MRIFPVAECTIFYNVMRHTFYLAPLRGVTDHIFRTAYERCFGAFDFLLAPFIPSTRGTEVKPSHVRDVAWEDNDRRRLIPQILGNRPDEFTVMARHMVSLGYRAVNWNLGCPHPQVTRKKRGSGLLPHPDLIERFLESVLPGLECALSVKVRLGYEDSRDLERLMPVFNAFPLAEVMIHPRTAVQMYGGCVDPDRFAQAAALCRHPVVYNGDIRTLDDFRALRRRFPATERWMIGRGVVYNPFLLSGLRNERLPEKDYSLLRRFHDELFEMNTKHLSGAAHLLGKMKGFWWYFADNFSGSGKTLKKLQRCTAVSQYRRRVDELFETA